MKASSQPNPEATVGTDPEPAMKVMPLSVLRAHLKPLLAMPDDTLISFGTGDLSLTRIKNRGPYMGSTLEQFEFNEIYTVPPLVPAEDDDESEPTP